MDLTLRSYLQFTLLSCLNGSLLERYNLSCEEFPEINGTLWKSEYHKIHSGCGDVGVSDYMQEQEQELEQKQ